MDVEPPLSVEMESQQFNFEEEDFIRQQRIIQNETR